MFSWDSIIRRNKSKIKESVLYLLIVVARIKDHRKSYRSETTTLLWGFGGNNVLRTVICSVWAYNLRTTKRRGSFPVKRGIGIEVLLSPKSLEVEEHEAASSWELIEQIQTFWKFVSVFDRRSGKDQGPAESSIPL